MIALRATRGLVFLYTSPIGVFCGIFPRFKHFPGPDRGVSFCGRWNAAVALLAQPGLGCQHLLL